MMKLLASLLLLAGCPSNPNVRTAVYEAAPQMYRPGDVAMWKIEGSSQDDIRGTKVIKRAVTIKINGTSVMTGPVSPGKDAAGELSGTYENKQVAASCSAAASAEDNVYQVRCVVMIDNERTVTLVF